MLKCLLFFPDLNAVVTVKTWQITKDLLRHNESVEKGKEIKEGEKRGHGHKSV